MPEGIGQQQAIVAIQTVLDQLSATPPEREFTASHRAVRLPDAPSMTASVASYLEGLSFQPKRAWVVQLQPLPDWRLQLPEIVLGYLPGHLERDASSLTRSRALGDRLVELVDLFFHQSDAHASEVNLDESSGPFDTFYNLIAFEDDRGARLLLRFAAGD